MTHDANHERTDERATDRERSPTGSDRGDRRLGSASRRDVLRTAGAAAAGTALGAGAAGTAGAQSAGSADPIPTPWLHREGNELRDPEGNKVVLRGVNVTDPARAEALFWRRPLPETIDHATDADEGWYSRVVRIPCQTGDIANVDPEDGSVGEGGATDEVEPGEFTREQLEAYVEHYLRPAVDRCEERGVYCIVDYHRHDMQGLEYTDPALDEEVRMFWETVAPEFAEDSHVLFEVYNEPIRPYDGQAQHRDVDVLDPEAEATWQQWKETAQPWVDTIREYAPRNVIVIGSPRWTQWTYWAAEDEFEGENLAYAGHVYAHENLRPLSEYFGEPSEEVPIFLSEFGYQYDTNAGILVGTTSEEGEEFREFLEEYDSVHWQAWCFDPFWEPIMFDFDDATHEWTLLGGEEYMGEFVRDYLREKRDDDLPAEPGSGSDDVPPSAPTGLTVTDTTRSTLDVAWEPATDEGGSGLDGYRVYLRHEDEAPALYEAVPAGETELTIEDLAYSRYYFVDVTAVDAAGNESDPATAVGLTDSAIYDTPPAPPREVTATRTSPTSVDLAWEPVEEPDPYLDGFAVTVDGELDHRVDARTELVAVDGEVDHRIPDDEMLRTTVEGLDPGTTYEIGVAAEDDDGRRSAAVTVDATTDAGDGPTLAVDLAVDTVGPDGTAEAAVSLSEAPDGLAGFTITVEVGEASVATVEDVAYADAFGLTEDPEYADDGSAVTLKAVDLNDEIRPGAEDVELATVELAAEGAGETSVGAAVDAVDSDDDGADVDPAVAGGALTVRALDPIAGSVPQDIDGDGIRQDLNASGDLDSDDVVLFFEYFDEPAIQNHPEAYDVNGSGELDFDDVTTLFEEL